MAIHKIYPKAGRDYDSSRAGDCEQLLNGGESVGTRRNAFLMLYHSDQDRAVQYLMANLESVANWGDIHKQSFWIWLERCVEQIRRKSTLRLF